MSDPRQSDLPDAGSARWGTPWAVLVISLGLTAACTVYIAQATAAKERIRFSANSEQVRDSIVDRLEMYRALLGGAAGLFAADNDVSREQFRSYVSRLDVQRHYPGIQGIGFSRRVPAREKDALVASARRQVPDFRIWPEQPTGDEYHTIMYLEPEDRRNLHALGYDMFTDPVRRKAMERARDTGTAAASGKVTLVQEIEGNIQAGFLLYIPVYRGGKVPETVEARREELIGFVYSPFRTDDLVRGIFGARHGPHIDFEIYDGEALAPEHLMHRWANRGPAYQPEFTDTMRLRIAGQQWTLLLSSNPQFDQESGTSFTLLALCSGIVVSAASFFMTRGQARAWGRAEQIAGELRVSEQALRASESRFRRLVESNLIGVVFSDLQGNIHDANEAYCRMIGRSLEDIRAGRVQREQIVAAGSEPVTGRAVEELRQNGACRPFERTYVRGDGTRVTALVGVALLEGSKTETVAFTLDLTELKRAEEDLRSAKEAAESANRAKDQFLAVLSHELRTPLTPVLAVAASSQVDASLPEPVRGDFAMIRRNIELEAKLIDDLLDLTRIGRGKLQLHLEVVDLHQVISSAVHVCAPDEVTMKRLHIALSLQARQHHVRGDPARLQQVFWNLIKNAIKFTPAGGRISIMTRNEVSSSEDDGLEVIAEVSDTGKGIEAEVLPRIFDAFEQGEVATTRTYGGLGLGLAISKGLVEAHGGTIEAASEGRGRGATFTVRLRTVEAPEPQCPQGHDGDGRSAERLSVLLVEDHEDTARAMARLLRGAGYEVHAADSVASAIELGRNVEFDVLVSDLGLPDGSGIELLRELRAARSGRAPFKAIALTGFGMEEDLARTRRAGFSDHLTKPVNFQKLQAAIESRAEE